MPLGKAYLVDTGTYYKSLFFIFKPFKGTFLDLPLPLPSLHSQSIAQFSPLLHPLPDTHTCEKCLKALHIHFYFHLLSILASMKLLKLFLPTSATYVD